MALKHAIILGSVSLGLLSLAASAQQPNISAAVAVACRKYERLGNLSELHGTCRNSGSEYVDGWEHDCGSRNIDNIVQWKGAPKRFYRTDCFVQLFCKR